MMSNARPGSSRGEAPRDCGRLTNDVMDPTSEIDGDEQHAWYKCWVVGAASLAQASGNFGLASGGGAR